MSIFGIPISSEDISSQRVIWKKDSMINENYFIEKLETFKRAELNINIDFDFT